MADALTEGTKIEGRYTLLRELGEGGFGEVWLARDSRLHRDVALKFMRAALASNASLRRRFEREGPILAQLDHPNVVRVYDLGTWEGRAFVALEYVDGGTLADWLDGHRKLRRATSASEVRGLFQQVCAGVAAAHAKGIVHRDLKPENVLLKDGDEGVVAKVLDFGLARAEGQSSSIAAKVGTWAYMSPEQAAEGSDEIGPSSDVFSLAVVLIELLTGRVLPREGSKLSWERLAYGGEAASALESVRSLRADVPEAVWSVVGRSLSRDPRSRPANAGAIAGELARAWGEPVSTGNVSAPPVPTSPPPSYVPPPRREHLPSVGGFPSMVNESPPIAAVEPVSAVASAPSPPPTPLPPRAASVPVTESPRVEAPKTATEIPSVRVIALAAVPLLGLAVWGLSRSSGEAPTTRTTVSTPTPTPSATPVPVPTVPSPAPPTPPAPASRIQPIGTCPEGMAYLEGGTFTMGSAAGEGDDIERPQHQVTLSPFCLGRTEVTVAAYRVCVQAGRCTAANTGDTCNWDARGREDHPINCIDWNQATAYCQSVGQRLPTEAEWEFAASVGGTRRYPWGDSAPSNQLCWSGASQRSRTCAVGSFPSGDTPAGLSDLSGNVWEWVSDWHGAYLSNSQTNPGGANSGNSRVYRGGCWGNDDPAWVRARYRNWIVPAVWGDYLGVRCASGTR